MFFLLLGSPKNGLIFYSFKHMEKEINSLTRKSLEETEKQKDVATTEERIENRHSDYQLIKDKINACRGAVTEKLGNPNVYQTAQYLYVALYYPEQSAQMITPNKEFPDRLMIFEKPLSVHPLQIPSEEEFIQKMRHAMTQGVDFRKCISEDSKNQLQQVMERSEHTVIWTNGDGIGVPSQGLPGSREQIKRLASAQIFNKFRRQIAEERGIDHKEVLSVVAQEGKMRFIPEIINRFLERGISRVVMVEDRMKNLVVARDIISKENPQVEVFPVWIRVDERERDKYNNGKTLEEWIKEFHAIDNISDLMPILQENNVFEENIKVGSIFDFDGPLNDDYKRKELQIEIVLEILQKNNWI